MQKAGSVLRRLAAFVAGGMVVGGVAPPAVNQPTQREAAVFESFVNSMRRCGVRPIRLPKLIIKTAPYLSSYFNDDNTIRLSRYEDLPPDIHAIMTEWAKKGTLGLTPSQLFAEIFNSLLIPHEMAHYLKEISGRSKVLDHWQGEVEANQIAIAFWSQTPGGRKVIANRIVNFERYLGTLPNPVPSGEDPHAYFEANYDKLGSDPAAYGWYQGAFMRTAWANRDERTFCGWVMLNKIEPKAAINH